MSVNQCFSFCRASIMFEANWEWSVSFREKMLAVLSSCFSWVQHRSQIGAVSLSLLLMQMSLSLEKDEQAAAVLCSFTGVERCTRCIFVHQIYLKRVIINQFSLLMQVFYTTKEERKPVLTLRNCDCRNMNWCGNCGPVVYMQPLLTLYLATNIISNSVSQAQISVVQVNMGKLHFLP